MSDFRFEQGPVECVMEEELCNTTEIGKSCENKREFSKKKDKNGVLFSCGDSDQ